MSQLAGSAWKIQADRSCLLLGSNPTIGNWLRVGPNINYSSSEYQCLDRVAFLDAMPTLVSTLTGAVCG